MVLPHGEFETDAEYQLLMADFALAPTRIVYASLCFSQGDVPYEPSMGACGVYLLPIKAVMMGRATSTVDRLVLL